jgi:hypothetical protein
MTCTDYDDIKLFGFLTNGTKASSTKIFQKGDVRKVTKLNNS